MMSDILIKQMPSFRKVYKKHFAVEKQLVDAAILEIIKYPQIGVEKKGDLAGVFVYKFKSGAKEWLLAYEWDVQQRILLALGVHQNFYSDLKKKIY